MSRRFGQLPSDGDRQDAQEAAYAALGDLVRAGSTDPSHAHAVEERRRFAHAFDGLHQRKRRRRAWIAAPAFAAACAAVIAWFGQGEPREETLAVVIEGDSVNTQRGEIVGQALPADTTMRFSEGTVAKVGKRSRATISQLGAQGATLLLAEGQLTLQVTKRPKAAWRVEAGPYLVEVTGTAFDVHWQQDTGDFRIDLRTGSVRVSGPGLAARTPLQAGHSLFVEAGAPTIAALGGRAVAPTQEIPSIVAPSSKDAPALQVPAPNGPAAPPRVARPAATMPLRRGPDNIAYETAQPAPREAPPEVPLPAAAPGNRSPTPPSTEESHAQEAAAQPAAPAPPPFVAPRVPVPVTWEQRLANGDHLAVVEDAEKLGLSEVLATRPLVDLKALADASRYAGRTQVAEQTLQTMRRRFAGSSAAHMAAFELGRLLDDGHGDPGRAADWYARYLSEAPSGSLAEEALVRLMVARVQQGEQAQAEAAARRYLQMYPGGSRAALAKQVAAGKASGR